METQSYLPKNSNLDINNRFGKSNSVDESSEKDKAIKKREKKEGSHYFTVRTERFFDTRYVTGQLLNDVKDKIHDRASFEKALKEAFMKDNSLKNLVDGKEYSPTKADIDALLNEPKAKEWIRINSKRNKDNLIIPYLTKRLFIGKAKANRVYNLLPEDSRAKLLTKAQQSQALIIKRASVPMQQPARAKRVSFSKQELNYIRMNKDLTPTKVTERLNIIFENKRSQASVLNRIKEYRRQK